MNIAQLLETKARDYASKPAFIFRDQPIDFKQLRDTSFRLAHSLRELGIQKGDKIALYLPNSPEYFYAYLAVWCCGATAVPLDFMLTEEELVSCASHAEAKLLIAKNKPNLSLNKIQERCPALKEVIICGEKLEPFLSFEELINKGKPEFVSMDINEKDYAVIFYTSGTTGRPKGVLVNYLQLTAPPKAIQYFANLTDKDVVLCALPFSHIAGLIFIQAAVFLGSTTVLMERFIPFEFLKNIQNYKITSFWLVPSMYYAILQLKEFEVFDLSSLETVICFGAPSSPEQLRRFHTYCPNADLINGWGMTETQGPSVVLPRGSKKVESVGLAAPWIEIKIFDDDDKELARGQLGEIAVRSWVVTDGYYKDPETTKEAMRNGWFHTGDLGRLDEQGYLYIMGRKKEMLKVAGEIVFEPEVEAVIHKHPDVAEAAVIGVADKLRGEVPKAFVVLKDGKALSEDELRYFCRQHLAHFKIPHYFEFKESLPKNRTGKIDKEMLKRI